ncbi:hypothetical protein BKA70DRAFT_558105 [Coprinopsis sp. MPI-PUGE-AT-0042]|nr:hypothetical protein BKA70DRAFT_558105 [Coprinopsis sp. MPI-PUGE-AT-0042]
MMDRIIAPDSREANANSYFAESWYYNDPLDEALLASCASYKAFERYVGGQDLLLLPRSPKELESILRRYAHDAIHNTIAQARSHLRTGGYSRMCHLAEKSIREVLNTGSNIQILLELHRPQKGRDESSKPVSNRPISTT